MIETIDLGEFIRYMLHRHITEKQAQWRVKAIAEAERTGSLGPCNTLWNIIYSAKIGTCNECGSIYTRYKNQRYDLK